MGSGVHRAQVPQIAAVRHGRHRTVGGGGAGQAAEAVAQAFPAAGDRPGVHTDEAVLGQPRRGAAVVGFGQACGLHCRVSGDVEVGPERVRADTTGPPVQEGVLVGDLARGRAAGQRPVGSRWRCTSRPVRRGPASRPDATTRRVWDVSRQPRRPTAAPRGVGPLGDRLVQVDAAGFEDGGVIVVVCVRADGQAQRLGVGGPRTGSRPGCLHRSRRARPGGR
jgi:hypothetical protein